MRSRHLIDKSLESMRSVGKAGTRLRGSVPALGLTAIPALADAAAKGLVRAAALAGVQRTPLVKRLMTRRLPQVVGIASSVALVLGVVLWNTVKAKSVERSSSSARARPLRKFARDSRHAKTKQERVASVLYVLPSQADPSLAEDVTTDANGATVDALSLLKRDHKEIADLLKEFSAAGSDVEASLGLRICDALTAHAEMEEQIFYPAARSVLADEDLDLVDEADVEHATIKGLVTRLRAASPSDDHFHSLVTVLGVYVRHHVKEEEKQLFPKLRRTDLDLEALGRELAAFKYQLRSEVSSATGIAEPA